MIGCVSTGKNFGEYLAVSWNRRLLLCARFGCGEKLLGGKKKKKAAHRVRNLTGRLALSFLYV